MSDFLVFDFIGAVKKNTEGAVSGNKLDISGKYFQNSKIPIWFWFQK